jgi:hypothetical protein
MIFLALGLYRAIIRFIGPQAMTVIIVALSATVVLRHAGAPAAAG